MGDWRSPWYHNLPRHLISGISVHARSHSDDKVSLSSAHRHSSFFTPTLHTLLKPTAPVKVPKTIRAKQAQNAARYPCINASGEPLTPSGDAFVTDPAIAARMAIPTAVPNWKTVLKTAPARACVPAGNTSVIIRFETVKMTEDGGCLCQKTRQKESLKRGRVG